MGEIHKIETDVAVVGGGTAGLNTAMAAAERGLKVLVAEKANIERSGAILRRANPGTPERLTWVGSSGLPKGHPT
jgi:flavin-dependent dehydrogenase